MNCKKITLPLLAVTAATTAGAADKKPNIVVILCDDMGFSDPGCFGGEIATPTLDRLAAEGVRFTQMYNSARSCPSRACILTGLYPHQVGMGGMTGNKKDFPRGYSGFRSDDNVTIAEALSANGYYTAMSGKWHLGATTPVQRGFEDYFGLLGGFNSFWNPAVYTKLPDKASVRKYPEGQFYATNAITDYAIEFTGKAKGQDKPFFLYLAYNAPHFPLHAPKERIDKYYQTYLKGWDAIRKERFDRIVQMGFMGPLEMRPRGIVPGSNFMNKPHSIPAWDSLSEDQRKDLARRMAVYAAMIDIMDEQIGRFLDALKERGQLDNTLIMFMSDNGACAEWHEFGFDGKSGVQYHTHTGDELDGMGQAGTYSHYGTGWANVCCTPFSLYKHYAHEGGISTPGIIWWGGKVVDPGRVDSEPCHFTDVMATCLDAAGAKYPSKYKGHGVQPAEGYSILPMVKGQPVKQRPIFAEHEGNRMVREGDWKLVASYFNGLKWELYNIREDRAEMHDLAKKYPDRVKNMAKMYDAWADRAGVEPYPLKVNNAKKQQEE